MSLQNRLVISKDIIRLQKNVNVLPLVIINNEVNMRINDFKYLQKEMIVNRFSDYRNYISLLKVMGNNHKYDF